MPIYEYLCVHCNRVYSFITPSASSAKAPTCPKCGATDLRKRMSRFAFIGRTRKSVAGNGDAGTTEADAPAGADSGPDPLDDPRVEREMMRLMNDAEGIDEDDPRQLGHLMRRMGEITGEKLDPEMEEAVKRLEAGEDPEKIEEDMGELLGEDEGGGAGEPGYDDGLYPM